MNTYPVIVTDSRTHIVWIEADNATEAVDIARDDYDLHRDLDSSTIVSGDLVVDAPDEWDLQPHGMAAGPEPDAHVREWERRQWEAQRESETAACTAAGHPDRREYGTGLITCAVCGITLAPARPRVAAQPPKLVTVAATGGVL